jgi:hypothetical protein
MAIIVPEPSLPLNTCEIPQQFLGELKCVHIMDKQRAGAWACSHPGSSESAAWKILWHQGGASSAMNELSWMASLSPSPGERSCTPSTLTVSCAAWGKLLP